MRANTTTANAAIQQTVRPDFVSDSYGFIQTRPLIDLVSSFGWLVDKVNMPRVRKASREGYQRHRITFKPSNWTELLARDGEYPQIMLTNSHDRTSALCFNFGWYRMACENGLMVGSAFISAFKVYHTGLQLEAKVRDVIEAALIRFPEVERCRLAMKSTLLDNSQLTSLVARTTKAVSTIRGFNISSPLYNIQRREDLSLDLWTVFNVLQEQSLSALTGSQTTADLSGIIRVKQYRARKVKSLHVDQKINNAVFNEAFKMLESIGA